MYSRRFSIDVPRWKTANAALAVVVLAVLLPLVSRSPAQAAEPSKLCRIEGIDADSGWPVPLVELRTTHQVSFVTDNAGVIAFDLPELMGKETWFTVTADGYEARADGFGM